jgi:hypothetical protein
MLRIEMLPAAHGDALWIEWGSPDDPRRMIVDGGPAHTYGALRDRILRLPPGHRRFELLVVTHIDTDHIDGVVRLIMDESLGVTFNDIWFNGWDAISEATADTLGAKQGEFLEALIQEKGLAYNEAFGGGAVVTQPNEPLPVRNIAGLRVTLLAPGPDELAELGEEWEEALEDEGWDPGDHDRALEELEARTELSVPASVEDELGDEDPSIPNKSSITLLIDDGEAKVLLTGDAHADVLLDALIRWSGEQGSRTVKVDALKLAHHGSQRNVSADLLGMIETPMYLVSSSGARFRHPHKKTIESILQRHDGDRRKPRVVFNYRSRFTDPWGDEQLQKDKRYVAIFPEGASVSL